MKQDIKNLKNETVGSVDLPDAIFGVDVRPDILQRVVQWQAANRQQDTRRTKTRAEVHGTGAKPWRQKGTGRARAGSLKTAQFRGGGIAFGPRGQKGTHKLPKKIRRLGLKSALAAKAAEKQVVILDAGEMDTPRTSRLSAALKALELKSALIVDGRETDKNIAMAARNIANVDILPSHGANVMDILRHETLVLTKAGLTELEERLK